jgi:hypothetical protein
VAASSAAPSDAEQNPLEVVDVMQVNNGDADDDDDNESGADTSRSGIGPLRTPATGNLAAGVSSSAAKGTSPPSTTTTTSSKTLKLMHLKTANQSAFFHFATEGSPADESSSGLPSASNIDNSASSSTLPQTFSAAQLRTLDSKHSLPFFSPNDDLTESPENKTNSLIVSGRNFAGSSVASMGSVRMSFGPLSAAASRTGSRLLAGVSSTASYYRPGRASRGVAPGAARMVAIADNSVSSEASDLGPGQLALADEDSDKTYRSSATMFSPDADATRRISEVMLSEASSEPAITFRNRRTSAGRTPVDASDVSEADVTASPAGMTRKPTIRAWDAQPSTGGGLSTSFSAATPLVTSLIKCAVRDTSEGTSIAASLNDALTGISETIEATPAAEDDLAMASARPSTARLEEDGCSKGPSEMSQETVRRLMIKLFLTHHVILRVGRR